MFQRISSGVGYVLYSQLVTLQFKADYFLSKFLISPQKMKNTKDNSDDFYDIALSFAGEDRDYVEKIANLLKNKKVKVFYDSFKMVDLWGKDLYQYLCNIYQNKSVYTIVFISEHYKNKRWTNLELKSAQARAFEDNEEYILPARFDNSKILGILPTTGFIDLHSITPEEFSEIICKKLDEMADKFMKTVYLEDFESISEISINKLLASLEWCFRRQKYDMVINLIRKIDYHFQNNLQWTRRKKYLSLALNAACKLEIEDKIIDFKTKIATIAMHQGDLDEAENLLKEILRVAIKHEDDNELFDVFHLIGRVYEAKGKYDKAKDFYYKALELSRKFLSKSKSCSTLHELAVVMFRVKKYENAIELYNESIEISNMTGYEYIKSCGLHGLGLIFQDEHFENRDLKKAIYYYKKSLEIKEKLNNQEEIARTEYQLADLYFELGKYKEALSLIQHSCDVFEKVDSRFLIQTKSLKSNILEKLNDN